MMLRSGCCKGHLCLIVLLIPEGSFYDCVHPKCFKVCICHIYFVNSFFLLEALNAVSKSSKFSFYLFFYSIFLSVYTK